MNNKAIKCLHHEEFIDRLIDNGFHFKVEERPVNNVSGEEDCPSVQYRLFIPTYEYREDTWNDVGYHYYGNSITMYYYIDFDDMEDIYELIREAIDVMKNYMKNEVAKKIRRKEKMSKEITEALKTLEVLDEIISPLLEPILAEYEDDLSDKITANYFALKQALIKAQDLKRENQLLKEKNAKYKELEEQLEYPFETMIKALKYGISKSDKLPEEIGLAQTMKNFLNRIKRQVDVGTYIDGDNYCIRFYEGWRKEKVVGWIGTTEEEFYQYRKMFEELEDRSE